MTPAERAAALFPRVLSPITGEMTTRRPSPGEVAIAIREAERAMTGALALWLELRAVELRGAGGLAGAKALEDAARHFRATLESTK